MGLFLLLKIVNVLSEDITLSLTALPVVLLPAVDVRASSTATLSLKFENSVLVLGKP